MLHVKNLIAGAGITGSVLAERIVSEFNEEVFIIDKRNHIGGNVNDYIDETDIAIHKYGPHSFHTNDKQVLDYLSQFTDWHFFMLRVKALIEGRPVTIPFNLNSLEEIFPKCLPHNFEKALLKNFSYGAKISIFELMQSNDEDLKFLTDFIYKHVFEGYTIKQWGMRPEELDKSVASRVSINTNRDDRYFSDTYQGIPLHGYTNLINNMLRNDLITVKLNTKYEDILDVITFNRLFYTGPIDEFFEYKLGKLEYRSLNFKIVHYPISSYQHIPHLSRQNNYDFTRSIECKFYMPSSNKETIVVYEYPCQYIIGVNEPSYPVPTLENGTGKVFFHAFTRMLEKCGYIMRGGSIVDATLIQAPSSTKNENKQRDPQMCQTKKGNQYYFGMKSHSGVDAGSSYVHSLEVTAANVHDITMTYHLIREDDTVFYGDAGYRGIEKREEITANEHFASIEYRINRRVGSVQKVPEGFPNWEKQIERGKSSVRSKVEHPFLIIKRFFGYSKTVYRGLAKNTHRLHMLFTSANLLMCIRAGRPLPA